MSRAAGGNDLAERLAAASVDWHEDAGGGEASDDDNGQLQKKPWRVCADYNKMVRDSIANVNAASRLAFSAGDITIDQHKAIDDALKPLFEARA